MVFDMKASVVRLWKNSTPNWKRPAKKLDSMPALVEWVFSHFKSGLVLHEKIQLISNGENFRRIWDYLMTSSGRVVFRFTDINKGFVDYEIETIKTLGYDNEINGMHVDGDVDVLGL